MRTKVFSHSLPVVMVLVTMMLWISSAYAVAQELKSIQVDEPVSRLTRYEVKQEDLKIFRKELHKYVTHAIRDESNIMAEGYYEEENPTIMWVIERWHNGAALDNNQKRIQYKTVKLLSEQKLTQPEKEFYVKDLEPLSKQQWRRDASKEEKPITIMLFVDSKVGTEDTFKEVYHTAMPQFRSEPGVVNYQLSQFVNDNTQFVTYEKFRNEAAFQYHLTFPPIQPVLDYLNTSIKQQPFQNGLHRLMMFAPSKRK